MRLSANGLPKRKIAVSLGLSATAAGDCIRRAREAGVAWPLAAELTDAALERLLYRSTAPVEKRRPESDWAMVHRELKRAGVTLQLLWEGYRAAYPGAFGFGADPARSGEPCKEDESRLVKHLSVEELQSIIDAPLPSELDVIRDRAMLHEAAMSGTAIDEKQTKGARK